MLVTVKETVSVAVAHAGRQVAVRERRVRQAVAEREQRGALEVQVGLAGADDVVVEQVGQVGVVGVPGLREPAGRGDVAGQDPGQRGARCLAAVRGPQHRGQARRVVDRVRVGRDQDQHGARVGGVGGAQQALLVGGQGEGRAVLGLAAVDVRVVARDHEDHVGLGGHPGHGVLAALGTTPARRSLRILASATFTPSAATETYRPVPMCRRR